MLIKTLIFSISLCSTQPLANLVQSNKKNDDYLLKKLVNQTIKIEDFDEIVLRKQNINQQSWNDFKIKIHEIFLIKKNKVLSLQIQNNHIFDPFFWTREIRPYWSWGSLHLSLTSNAINQFFELASNSESLVSAIIGAGIAMPVWGAVLVAFLAVSITAIKAIDRGEGVTIRFLFGLIPSGFWAN